MKHSLSLTTSNTVTDPVCGMQVDPATAPATTSWKGQAYYFCCSHCLQKFTANPDSYVGGSVPKAEVPPAAAAAEYYCPMCPDVVSDKPGACPKCGMALEPRLPSLAAAPNAELRAMTLRFWLALLLGLPVIANAMASMIRHQGLLPHGFWELILASAVALGCGWPIFERAWTS